MDQSWKTYRVQNHGHPEKFPVRVWFTRPLDPYERNQLVEHGIEIEIPDRDPMQGIIETTSQFFGQVIETLNAELPGVEKDAEQARAAALAEDEHLAALVQQINLRINPQ
ncbi:hypothetical protein [Mycobacterium sp. 1165196.3]|uniref:hypothetical protein n=1 Tax=Mycobacterium sp. 1165196.3 TaxID=1834071 RepID=UPI0012EA5256|nr:hypothetical protein [Mycobacterium sp. 1165196.3]